MNEQLTPVYIHPDLKARGDECVLRYLDMIAAGTTPKMAEMLALQQSPGIGVTNSQYLQDQNRWGRSILDRHNGDERAVERLRGALAKRGYKLRSDDHYISTAARFHGDPAAIVNEHSSFKDLERRVEERQKIKADTEPTPPTRLSPTIVERIRQRRIAENPDEARRDIREVTAEIVETHGAKP